jgi:hypothetical protein
METFLLYANAIKADDAGLLRKAIRITKRMMPSLGLEMEVHERRIPEINGGWFYMMPRIGKAPLITECADSQGAVIVFGELYGNPRNNAAEMVLEKWRAEGPDGVRLMDGCFSAVLVDLAAGAIHLCTDLLGHRSVRFFNNNHLFIASPHDISIVATGCCAGEIDLVSAASVVSFDWSLEGRSLLREVSAQHPNELITWRGGTLTRQYKPVLNSEGTLDERNHGALNRHLKVMTSHAIENVRTFCGDEPTIKMDLTAGIDSRAVLAILLSSVGAERVKAFTAGERDARDVKMARRLARTYRINHGYGLPEKIDYNTFYQYCRLRAFLMNGDTDGKRAAAPLPAYDETPNLHGGGGGIFKGVYYYPDLYRQYSNNSPDDQQVLDTLEEKHNRFKTLPWSDDNLTKKLRERLSKIVDSYSAISNCGWDKLDLFHMYERYGRWGSMVPRSTWEPRRFSPFCSPTLINDGFKLPRPIAGGLRLHKALIKDALPLAYFFFPVNETDYLPLKGHTYSQILVSRFTKKATIFVKKLDRAFVSRQSAPGHDADRAALFGQLLRGDLKNLLLEEKGIARRILRKEELIKMMEAHMSGAVNYLPVFGSLPVMEAYRHLVDETHELAKC